MRASSAGAVLVMTLLTAGCASADIPQAYRGQMFGRTGPLAFYTGRTGFYGPVLGPGTYFTGTYDEIPLFVESGDSVIALSEREPGAALALGTPNRSRAAGAVTGGLLG